MAFEEKSSKYIRAISIGMLGYIGLCTGVAVFSAPDSSSVESSQATELQTSSAE